MNTLQKEPLLSVENDEYDPNTYHVDMCYVCHTPITELINTKLIQPCNCPNLICEICLNKYEYVKGELCDICSQPYNNTEIEIVTDNTEVPPPDNPEVPDNSKPIAISCDNLKWIFMAIFSIIIIGFVLCFSIH